MQPTTQHYDDCGAELANRYESASMKEMHSLLLRHLPGKGRVLEIGCGSGRDAAFLLQHGYDVTAVDASKGMVSAAKRHHPELDQRITCNAFPFSKDDPLLEARFDAIVLVAVVMHITDTELSSCATQFATMLSPDGVVFISTSTGRGELDGLRAPDGRLFNERAPEDLERLFIPMGFNRIAMHENADSFARTVCWFSLVLGRKGDRS